MEYLIEILGVLLFFAILYGLFYLGSFLKSPFGPPDIQKLKEKRKVGRLIKASPMRRISLCTRLRLKNGKIESIQLENG